MMRGMIDKATLFFLFLFCVSSSLVFSDDRQVSPIDKPLFLVQSEVFKETLEKIRLITSQNAETKTSILRSSFQPSSVEAKAYVQTNKRLERFIAEINSYATELKAKAEKGELSGRDVRVLRRTFSRLSVIEVNVINSLVALKESILKTSGSTALNNIDALIKTIEASIKKLETAIAIITAKGSSLISSDFDALIELTQQQTINQSASDVSITPLELHAEALDTSGTVGTPLTPAEIANTLAPPTAADLFETIEVQFTPEIVALAASLNNSPIEIYEHVRNKVDFEPYFGSRKGGAATLLTENGNDYDQASLLLALLRTSGIPARYVRGTVEIPVQRVLDWLGLKDLNAPNTILNTAGINAVPVVGGGGLVEVYRIDRVWVAAYVPFGNYRGTNIDDTGKAWVPLDPAFNISQYQAGVDNITDSVPFDEAGYLSEVRTETAADFYRDQMFDYLAANTPGTSLVDVPYYGISIPQNFGIIPASLPYTVLSIASEFSEVPGTLRHAARITVRAGGGTLLNATLLLPEVSLSRRTISFTAATAADQATIDSFGGIANTPPFLVNVKPQLKIEGVLHTDGSSVNLGAGVAVDVGFIFPEVGENDSVSHLFLTAGDFISVNLDVGQTNEKLLSQRTEKLLNALETIGVPIPDAQQDEVTGELLNIGGLLYWLRMNDANELISGLYQYKQVLGVSESLTTSNMDLLYLFDRPYAAVPGNLNLDAARLLHSRFSINGEEAGKAAFNRLLGIESSAREHAMWEELVSVQSISTIKALQIAGQTGIPIHRFDSTTAGAPVTCIADSSTDTVLNCMAKCGVSNFTRESISTELSSGKEITTHQCVINLNQWNGVGYISADPVTQSGAYIISGGLNSVTETGAETTITANNPITQIDSQTGSQIIEQLPTHQITENNIQELLYNLLLPTRLIKHIESLVADGNTATVSEVIVEIDGNESLVYQLDSDALTQSEYYRFDTLNGGAGTESPPGSLGDPNGNTGNGDGTGMAGDPVNIANGSFYREERDFAITALGYPLAFDRFYNSGLTEDDSLGLGWTHTYSDKVIELPDDSVTWINTLGGAKTYTPDGLGGYVTPQGVDSSLTKTATKFTLTSKKGEIQNFNLSGQLTARKNTLNQGVDLSYTSGRLTTVTDTTGRSLTFTYNTAGKIATVTDFTGRTWMYSYTGGQLSRVQSPSDATTLPKITRYSYYTGTLSAGLLKTITEPNGGIRRLRYYTNLRVYDVKGPEGGRERFAYDLLTNTTVFTDQRGNRTRYRHNDDGNIVEIRYPDGSRERWTWANHQIVSHRDTLGYTETYQYDSNRNLTRHTDRMGLVTTYTYDPVLSVMTQMTRPGGRIFNYTYDTNGSLVRVDDPVGGSFTTTSINAFGLPDSATDPRGITTNTQYNAIGQPNGISVSGEYSVSLDYTLRGNPSRTVDANGHATVMEYDLLDRLIRREDAEGYEMSFQYDAAGRAIKVANQRGYETLLGYDLNDRLVTQTDALLNTIVHDYDLAGNLVREIDRLGRVTSHIYDNRNRRIKTTFPNGTTMTMRYDSENRLTAFTDPLGNKTNYTIDGNGRITNSTDALLNSTAQTYDINGNLQSITNRRGGVTSYEYDLFNQVTKITGEGGYLGTVGYDAIGNKTQSALYDVSGLAAIPADPRTLPASRKRIVDYVNTVQGLQESITDPEGEIQQIIRDSKGNVTTIIDRRNKSTSYQYDFIDRVVKIIHPDLTETNLTYDENDNLTSLTTPGNGVWNWTYDELDRVQTATDPLARTTLFEYDAVGNFIKQTNPDASSVSYTYDALNRRLHTARSNGTYTTLMYDSAGNMVFGETEKTILIATFDALNRISSEFISIPKSGFSRQIGFGYDFESNLTSANINSIGTLSYGYDLADRVTSINNSADGSSIGITYNGFGDRSAVNYGNGTVGNMSYDKLGRVTQIDYGSSIAQTGYIRDPDGNPTTINESIASISEQLTVTYDDLGRPISSTALMSPSRSETFAYDDNGNLTNTGIGNNIKYDVADQISYDGASTYAMDSQGNITQKNKLGGVLSDYTYDPENKLIHVRQTNGATVTNDFDNVYDALNRLVETNANGVPIRRVYIGLNPFIDFNTDNSINTLYTTGPAVDDIFAATISGVQHYIHRDLIGSVRATTDSAGLVSSTKNYSLYGRIQDQTGSSNVLLGYTGRPFDPMTGLTDLRARWLDPEIGRFTSRDPVPLRPIMPNPYSYADNKPLKYIDPLGLSPENPGNSWWDGIQGGLELGGLWPGIGMAPDLLNALISGLRGNGLAALGHLGSAVPGAGQGVTAAKMANRAADAAKALRKAGKVRDAAKAKKVAGKADSAFDGTKKGGRSGKQARLRELANDPKLGKADRGWIKQEQNSISRGNRKNIRNPPGKDLAHERGREAAKGYGYKYSNLQDRKLHRTQHKYDNFGRNNKERPPQ